MFIYLIFYLSKLPEFRVVYLGNPYGIVEAARRRERSEVHADAASYARAEADAAAQARRCVSSASTDAHFEVLVLNAKYARQHQIAVMPHVSHKRRILRFEAVGRRFGSDEFLPKPS